MYDRTAAFEAFFKRVEDGYIFYRHRFARGISVTEAEHDRMVTAHKELNDGNALVAFLLIAVAAGLIAIFGATTYFSAGKPIWAYVLLAAIFSGVMLLAWLGNRSIREPILGRKADQPRRDSREFDVALGRANTRLKWLLVLVIGLQVPLNLSRAIERGSLLLGAVALFFAVAFLFLLRLLYRTWRANSAQQS